jgi:hypothetical protein
LEKGEDLETIWDKTRKTLREIFETGREKAEEYTKKGKERWEIYTLKREIAKQFTQLGGLVYGLIVEKGTTRIAGDQEVKERIDKIKELEEDLRRKEKSLGDLSGGD